MRKEHPALVVAVTGQRITEQLTAAIAERVTQHLAATAEWTPTLDEQVTLLEILASDSQPSKCAATTERARALLGDVSMLRDR